MGKCISKPAVNLSEITTDEENNVPQSTLRNILCCYIHNKPCFHFSDRMYHLHTKHEIKKFLKRDLTNKLEYIPDRFDCDDFTWVVLGKEREWYLKSSRTITPAGSAFGVVWGDIRPKADYSSPHYHACNFFVDNEKKFWLVEPQTDKVYPLYKNSKITMLIV